VEGNRTFAVGHPMGSPASAAIFLRSVSQPRRLLRLRAKEAKAMRRKLAVILGIGLVLNALRMLAAPAAWYAAVPGVPETGPFNPHFVRDIGAAYLVAGAALVWFAASAAARPAAQAGAAFLALHALIHLWDAAAGREQAHQLLLDFAFIFLPAILAAWIAWPPQQRQYGETP
jgi:uncharacterized protein YjeT (DUF2065 family)